MKRCLITAMAFVTIISVLTQAALADELTYWAEGESRTAFLDYVAAVTDPDSPDFIPETDRLAVFDLDGTLLGEQFPIYVEWMMYVHRVLDDPEYEATEEQVDLAGEILTAAGDQNIPSDLEERLFSCNAEVYAGMTVDEYRAYVTEFLQTSADRFDGLTIADAWFRTTVEAAKYLESNGFTVYVCSGTDREMDRVLIADILGIPYRQVIGSDCYTEASGQAGSDYLDYQYTADDETVRTANTIIKNVKSSKPMQIEQELGQRPVLAFGNSTGDISMFAYTTAQTEYRSIAFCVLPDDDGREVAYPEKAEKLSLICEENGWYTVSMKNDFVTIYGDDVTLDLDSTPWLDSMRDLIDELRADDAA